MTETAPERIWASPTNWAKGHGPETDWSKGDFRATGTPYSNAQEYVHHSLLDEAVKALEECEAEIDAYVRQEYPGDHPVHERYRQRDFSANPARIALAAIFAKLRSKP